MVSELISGTVSRLAHASLRFFRDSRNKLRICVTQERTEGRLQGITSATLHTRMLHHEEAFPPPMGKSQENKKKIALCVRAPHRENPPNRGTRQKAFHSCAIHPQGGKAALETINN